MSDVLADLATTLAKQGVPVLSGLIGTAIGGPAGALVGGLAGKALCQRRSDSRPSWRSKSRPLALGSGGYGEGPDRGPRHIRCRD